VRHAASSEQSSRLATWGRRVESLAWGLELAQKLRCAGWKFEKASRAQPLVTRKQG
jgi:hypothetical protein